MIQPAQKRNAAADRQIGKGSALRFVVFNAAYGVAWFLGSTLMGILYDVSLSALAAFAVTAQLASVPLLHLVAKETRVP